MLVNTNMNVLWSHSSRLEFFPFFFPSSLLLSLCSQVEQWPGFPGNPPFWQNLCSWASAIVHVGNPGN